MKKLPIIVPLFLRLSGCVVPNQNRKGAHPWFRLRSPTCLAFLEFDDTGEMFEPAQLTRASDPIERAKAVNKSAVVVTFVHGLKSNAAEQKNHTAMSVGLCRCCDEAHGSCRRNTCGRGSCGGHLHGLSYDTVAPRIVMGRGRVVWNSWLLVF